MNKYATERWLTEAIKIYESDPTICNGCRTPIELKGRYPSTVRGLKFCGHSCSAKISNRLRTKYKTVDKPCKTCGEPIVGSRIFCNANCRSSYTSLKHTKIIEAWELQSEIVISHRILISVIRPYLLKQQKGKCSLCGWTGINPISGNISLELDHIDGDWTNNLKGNIRLICPNCHSLTPTFRGLNRGNRKDNRMGMHGHSRHHREDSNL